MANRYWVGGAGTWSSTNTANWSATSGGAGGATVPSVSDDVVFDTNSGTGVVTFTNSAVTVGNTSINNANIELSLGAAFATSGSLTLTSGIFTTNNYNVTAASLASSSVNTRTINLGSSTVTLTLSSGNAFSMSSITGLTFNSGTSQITLVGTTQPSFFTGGLTFYNVSFTGTQLLSPSITGNNIFNNLTIAGRNAAGISSFNIFADQTINGTLTLSAGTNATMRTFVRSDTIGTTRTLTCAAVASLTDIDFRDITIAGSAAPVSGTRLGDCKGNSGITFDAPKTVYWRASSGANWGASTSSWSLTAGGTATHAAFPLAQDTAVFTATYPSSGTTPALGAAYNIGTIDMSDRTTSIMTFVTSILTPSIYGNWITGTGITFSGTGTFIFAGRGSQTITSAGKTFTQGINIDSPGGSVTLLDALTTNRSAAGALTVTQGTFDANGYNVTISATGSSVEISGSITRTVGIGSGTWTIAGSGTSWRAVNATNLTVTGAGTISLTSASAKTFAGGGIQTYPTINQGGTGALTITGSNKFANITNTALGAVRFTGGTTTEFGAFNLNGTSTAARLTVGSTDTTQAILKKPTAWNVGTGSLDGGNNTGLSFTAGTNDFLSISGINGQISTPAVTYNSNFFAFF